MYSNENKKGFSILDLLVKIIFFGILIFIIVWLFQKKIPNINMEPFYSNVFRENIKYMQEAGESYFTDEKMPQEEGQTVKLTLEEMEKMNIILPFVDKDGKACNKTDSYVSITKLEGDAGYELKTNLVCGTESNYVTKTLGCHNYCPNSGNCGEKKCTVAKVTEYEFKKAVDGKTTKYSCESGWALNGKTCTKKKLVDSKSAIHHETVTRTIVKPATLVPGESKLKQLETKVTTKELTPTVTSTQLTTTVNTQELTPTVTSTQLTTSHTQTQLTTTHTQTQLTTIKTGTQQAYTCTKTRTETQCTTTYVQEPYSCNCRTTIVNGVPTTVCNTCYRSVPVQNCHDVQVEYTTTCYKTVYTYSCPSGTTSQTGSGANLKCYKDTYSCPSGTTDQTGSGANLKCYKKTYKCPSGTTDQTGSGSSLKCYKKTYSCPSGTTDQTGSGANLKCYKKTYKCPSGTTNQTGSGSSLKCYKKTYSCPSGTDVQEGSGANLKCYKVISGTPSYKCPDSSYTLEGDKCNKYQVSKKDAKATTTTTTSYKYTWSTQTELAGWTRTGKTRTVNGKEVCK